MSKFVLVVLVVLGLLIGLSGLMGPQDTHRVIYEGATFQVFEDTRTGVICLVDKKETKPPECKYPPADGSKTYDFTDQMPMEQQPQVASPYPQVEVPEGE